MRLGRSALELLLATNVVELRFHRRIPKAGFNAYRRMLCTKDMALLKSGPGINILNYRAPSGSLKYDPASKNLIVTWDIFLQNWRMINCDDVDIVAVIKSSPDPTQFWTYFNDKIRPMAAGQKASFNNT
jgi:hypothetical protein